MSTYTPHVLAGTAAGHPVRSVVARDEPERQRMRAMADLESALPSAEHLARRGATVRAVATTPDFHPGKPVPVGVVVDMEGAVLPHLVGNDIGCGMRMMTLEGIAAEDLADPVLEKHLRHVFFQGGRDVALRGRDRHAILRHGLPGLVESISGERRGLLAKLDMSAAWRDLDRMSDAGAFQTTGIDPDFDEYAEIEGGFRHDAILGTIGGGNHFVELGVVEAVVDGGFAGACGIRKGSVVLVVHSGSLDFGQRVGSATREKLRAARTPDGEDRIVPLGDPMFARYVNGHANAANVAFANRFLIGLAAVEAISRTVGRDVGHSLVYDAPHNTVWEKGGTVRHRKGACPAGGVGTLPGSPYEWLGEPVILPGSMGDGTWLLKGMGSAEGLSSSAHGAGRRLSRQEARAVPRIAGGLRVVGPVDPMDPAVRGRRDILSELDGRLREEAPAAYRPIDRVVDPMVEAGLAGRVARVSPLLTVKG
ncbi:RtcB family protein [Pararhizobium sp. BT-229]|uniref:RtcB family protein n=1 Tax=Pararhizobium sp. BT-229 TaxID=2986923 RepID=UPI0021F7F80D|nr:RtcB family protein [Pararhizobium sp. BT-229]MCV9963645.1 RtcB family protein [Pararhizobium sp. BT-229]